MWALVKDGAVVETIMAPKSITAPDGTVYPAQIFKLWSPEALRAIGLFPVEVQKVERPDLHRLTGFENIVEPDRVVRVPLYTPLPLEDAKARARARINAWKQGRQDGNFTHDGAEYQCDPRSREFITGASLDAFMAKMAGVPFTIVFTDATNTQRTLDADAMIALGRAAKAHVEHWHIQGLAKKEQVEQAVTVGQILTVLASLEG